MDVNDHDQGNLSIRQVLSQLPAFEDDVYLGMQATNLDVVDGYLRELEKELLQAYIESERTPTSQAIFVSALSQLWVLGLYELLRTWRQRISELLAFSNDLSILSVAERRKAFEQRRKEIKEQSPYLKDTDSFRARPYRRVMEDDSYPTRLMSARDSSEVLFRRLEALRMALAKHEIPRARGSTALAPGYGRIDMATGSIYWQVALGTDEVDSLSRRKLSDEIPSLLRDVSAIVLSEQLQGKVKKMPKYSYALKRVSVTLSNGSRFHGTLVAWNKVIVGVLGHEDLPFDGRDVVDVCHEASDEGL